MGRGEKVRGKAKSTASRAEAPRRAPRRRVRKQTLWSQSPPTRRWSLVGGADEHLAARSSRQWMLRDECTTLRQPRVPNGVSGDGREPDATIVVIARPPPTAPHRTAWRSRGGGKDCSSTRPYSFWPRVGSLPGRKRDQVSSRGNEALLRTGCPGWANF